jgi:hypothetical protein
MGLWCERQRSMWRCWKGVADPTQANGGLEWATPAGPLLKNRTERKGTRSRRRDVEGPRSSVSRDKDNPEDDFKYANSESWPTWKPHIPKNGQNPYCCD